MVGWGRRAGGCAHLFDLGGPLCGGEIVKGGAELGEDVGCLDEMSAGFVRWGRGYLEAVVGHGGKRDGGQWHMIMVLCLQSRLLCVL